ncbi:MAG: hypothetical protein NZ699_16970 [Roseiflexus sp.]|nr:hypothetical protein [Roseiflexus sp.]MCS7290815.1 hypothetical protein [Roseiflexus sp.]MDW8146877.1 hypothetical protein [Roseiflexaceae bacterium]MDW8233374.1 hypothetical protein [Roseiflexaceae bacterium]
MTTTDDRLRILRMIEQGQISAEEGARLLEAITDHRARTRVEARARSLRVVVTDLHSRRQKINVTIPASLVSVGLKLGARLFPRDASVTNDDVLRAIERDTPGRIFELQDLEEGERIEIFVE